MQPSNQKSSGSRAEASVTVNRPAKDLYEAWKSFEHHATFMKYVESVEKKSERKSHWKLAGPAGVSAEWDAEITEDEEGERIAWQTTDEGDVWHAGWVRFDPADENTTEVRVRIDYEAPRGAVKKALSKVTDAWSKKQLKADLDRFKELMERES